MASSIQLNPGLTIFKGDSRKPVLTEADATYIVGDKIITGRIYGQHYANDGTQGLTQPVLPTGTFLFKDGLFVGKL